jgi:hypothetical protein
VWGARRDENEDEDERESEREKTQDPEYSFYNIIIRLRLHGTAKTRHTEAKKSKKVFF